MKWEESFYFSTKTLNMKIPFFLGWNIEIPSWNLISSRLTSSKILPELQVSAMIHPKLKIHPRNDVFRRNIPKHPLNMSKWVIHFGFPSELKKSRSFGWTKTNLITMVHPHALFHKDLLHPRFFAFQGLLCNHRSNRLSNTG